MGVVRRRETGGLAVVPRHLGAIQGVVHHRSFRSVSGPTLYQQSVALTSPLIEQAEDVGYG